MHTLVNNFLQQRQGNPEHCPNCKHICYKTWLSGIGSEMKLHVTNWCDMETELNLCTHTTIQVHCENAVQVLLLGLKRTKQYWYSLMFRCKSSHTHNYSAIQIPLLHMILKIRLIPVQWTPFKFIIWSIIPSSLYYGLLYHGFAYTTVSMDQI